MPALKQSNGEWQLQAEDKAQLLADTFADKCKLRPAEENQYSLLTQTTEEVPDWEIGTETDAEKTLEALRADSATGPDRVPAKALNF